MFDDKENVGEEAQTEEVTQAKEPVSEAGEETSEECAAKEASEETAQPADEEEQGEEKTGQEADGEPSGKEEDGKKPFLKKKKKDKKDQQIEELQDNCRTAYSARWQSLITSARERRRKRMPCLKGARGM